MASPALRRAYLELCYRPVSARQIASATRLVGEIFGEPIGEADAISRVTLAVHEILENLAKYSAEEVPS
jgi:anti-sigma regulatory factor (Ser/Thr protein kinase)